MKKILFLLTVLLLLVCCSNEDSSPWKQLETTIIIDPNQTEESIEPEFFGVCPMFWQEDDSYMTDGQVEQYLKDMNCRFLRFPGGTESDNFIWNENNLHSMKRWPGGEQHLSVGTKAMDVDEFIALCDRLNAEPILCVNTEIGVWENNYQKAIELAVSWVKYCKDKGYTVRYWEIGNEPYYNYCFTATEYAQLFVQMTRAMKQVDPNIKVVAVGEWNYLYKGHKDNVAPENWNKVVEMEWSVDTKDGVFSESQLSNIANYTEGEQWWPEVLRVAGSEIDVASIHWYYNLTELAQMTEYLNSLTDMFKPYNKNGKEIELIMTEWTLHESVDIYGMERALTVAEAIGRSLDGKVKKATYWPLRCAGSHDKKGLLDMTDEKGTRANYDVMKLFANNIGMTRIHSSGKTNLYHFATKTSQDKIQLFLVNRTGRSITNKVELKGWFPKKCVMKLLDSENKKDTETPTLTESEVAVNNNPFEATLPPYSMAVYILE